jgi:hypothetical protein
MTDLRAAAQQALEALVVAWQQNPHWQITEAITALRAALEQEEQELRTRSVSVPSGATPTAKIESVTLLPNDVDAIEFLTRQRDVLLQVLRIAADSQDELVKSLRAMVEKNHE